LDTNPLYYLPVVSEIFSIKVTDRQTRTSTDNKGRLKLAACEPTNGCWHRVLLLALYLSLHTGTHSDCLLNVISNTNSL